MRRATTCFSGAGHGGHAPLREIALPIRDRLSLFPPTGSNSSRHRLRASDTVRTSVRQGAPRLIYDPTLRQTNPRAEPKGAMCVQRISAQCVLQFTPSIAAGCVLHRTESRVIHRIESCKKSAVFAVRPQWTRGGGGRMESPREPSTPSVLCILKPPSGRRSSTRKTVL